MTDLDKRIEVAKQQMMVDDCLSDQYDLPAGLLDEYRDCAERIVRAAVPELFADPPTHWLAPWEPDIDENWGEWPASMRWRNFRDAYLKTKEQGR